MSSYNNQIGFFRVVTHERERKKLRRIKKYDK